MMSGTEPGSTSETHSGEPVRGEHRLDVAAVRVRTLTAGSLHGRRR
jgi:hypothetical protein